MIRQFATRAHEAKANILDADPVLYAAIEALLRVQKLDPSVFDAALLLPPGAPLSAAELRAPPAARTSSS